MSGFNEADKINSNQSANQRNRDYCQRHSAGYMLNKKRKRLAELEDKFSKNIIIKGIIGHKTGETAIHCTDSNGNRIAIR